MKIEDALYRFDTPTHQKVRQFLGLDTAHRYFLNPVVLSLLIHTHLRNLAGVRGTSGDMSPTPVTTRGFSALVGSSKLPEAPSDWPVSLEWTLRCRGDNSAILGNGGRAWTVVVAGDNELSVGWPGETGLVASLYGTAGQSAGTSYGWTTPFRTYNHAAMADAAMRNEHVLGLLSKTGLLGYADRSVPQLVLASVSAALCLEI